MKILPLLLTLLTLAATPIPCRIERADAHHVWIRWVVRAGHGYWVQGGTTARKGSLTNVLSYVQARADGTVMISVLSTNRSYFFRVLEQ